MGSRVPTYLRARVLIDPASGEEVGALVPASPADRDLLRKRRLKPGDLLRGQLTQPRNLGFHNLAHKLGQLIVENIDAFAGVDPHEALKRLQRESGMGCDQQHIEIPGLGTCLVNVPRSMAFDRMDEADFRALLQGLCRYLSAVYWPECDEGEIAAMVEFMPAEEGA